MVAINLDIWKKIWQNWNVRGFILFSLGLQIFLIAFGSSRKRTKSFLIGFVWITYLLADWAANYCVGLITKSRLTKSTTSIEDYLTAFWAQFLLLHLGGPDTITAFSLEDNELWRRHLSGLIVQAISAGNIFFVTIPENTLWLPTLLVFLAGSIKYGERICALYFGSINTFRKSLVKDPDPGPNYAKLMEEYSSMLRAGFPADIEVVPEHDQEPDEAANDKEPVEELEEVQKAYLFFQKFKGLIVDMIYSFGDRRMSQGYFQKIKAEEAEKALRVIEIELNFMYEDFYTKASVVRHWFGYSCKFFCFISVVIALGLFTSTEKHVFNELDVKVTYTLLYGALALDAVAFFMLVFTDHTAASSIESHKYSYGPFSFHHLKITVLKHFNEKILVHFLKLRKPSWKICEEGPYKEYEQLSTGYLYRRWSGTISGYNLLTYCLDQSNLKVPNNDEGGFYIAIVIQNLYLTVFLFVKAIFDQWTYKANLPFLKKLWENIFDELKRKSKDAQDIETIQSICSARGEWVVNELWESIFHELNQKSTQAKDEDTKRKISSTRKQKESIRKELMPFVDPEEVPFDQSLLLWHIATHLCYAQDKSGGNKEKRDFSMLLSDYMLYLLVIQPTMMSAVAGIGKIRFQDTCAEAIRFFSKRSLERKDRNKRQKEACKILMKVPTERKPIDVKGDRSKSLLFDACILARVLMRLKDEKWDFIIGVWVEMLSFAASHSRPTTHVQALSKGGELISFVWLLMTQLGLGTQFQIKEGNARAKLIV